MAGIRKKPVVKVDSSAAKPANKAAGPTGARGGGGTGGGDRVWTPTPESKSKATTLRIIAWVLWIVAIGIEAVGIWLFLPKVSEGAWPLWPLLVILVPIAAAAITANLLWKQANRLDPASKANAAKFFIQNQLGAFMTVLAFLPLIIFILADKGLDGKQKSIAGILGAVVMLAAASTGVSWDGGPSQEQYAEETNIVQQLTGANEVFWVKGGSVFHVCEAVPDVNKESKDGQIYTGTVASAHEAGKSRLTLKWESEATSYCGYTQEQVDAVKAKVDAPGSGTSGGSVESPAQGPDEGAPVSDSAPAESGPTETEGN